MFRSRLLLVLLLLIMSPSLHTEECTEEVTALNALYGVRDLVIRDVSSWTIDREIDDRISTLREPLPDGGYKWLRRARPESGRGPYEREKHFVRSDSKASPDIFEAVASDAWSVVVVVPRKRSLFRKNDASWIGDVTVTCSAEGRTETKRESIQRWMQPDTSHTIDIGIIADRCRAQVEAVTNTESLDEKALVEIHVRQAVWQDHPDNPNFETIKTLERVRSDSTPGNLDREISRLERRLFPDLHAYPFATLLTETREAQRLLRSDEEEERTQGAEKLEAVVEALKDH